MPVVEVEVQRNKVGRGQLNRWSSHIRTATSADQMWRWNAGKDTGPKKKRVEAFGEGHGAGTKGGLFPAMPRAALDVRESITCV